MIYVIITIPSFPTLSQAATTRPAQTTDDIPTLLPHTKQPCIACWWHTHTRSLLNHAFFMFVKVSVYYEYNLICKLHTKYFEIIVFTIVKLTDIILKESIISKNS